MMEILRFLIKFIFCFNTINMFLNYNCKIQFNGINKMLKKEIMAF